MAETKEIEKASGQAAAIAEGTFYYGANTLVKPKAVDDWISLGYKRLLWTHVPIKANADAIADLDLRLFKVFNEGNQKKELVEVEDHPILDLIYHPNPNKTKNQMLNALVVYLECVGQGYWEIVYDVPMEGAVPLPSELYGIRPSRITPVPDKEGRGIKKYVFQVRKHMKKKDFKPEEIVNFQYFDPLSDWTGMGNIMPAENEMLLEDKMINWEDDFFKKGTIDGLLTTEAVLTKKDIQDVLSMWQRRLSKEGRSTMLVGKGVKFQPMGKSPQDVDFLLGRKDNRTGFLAAEGVSPIRAGILENAKYDNYKLQEEAFNRNTIIPKANTIAAALTLYLVPRYPDLAGVHREGGGEAGRSFRYVLKFDVKALLQEDEDKLVKRQNIAIEHGTLTPNEARQERDLETYPEGDTYYVTKNLIPVKQALAGPEETERKKPEMGGEEEVLDVLEEEVAEKVDKTLAKLEETVELMEDRIVEKILERVKEEAGKDV